MTTFVDDLQGVAFRHRRRPDRRPTSTVTRVLVGALIACGLGLGMAPQLAQASPAPPASDPSTFTESTVVTPALCSIEVILNVGETVPATTLPGTCVLSAISGVFANPQQAPEQAADPLASTGSSTGLAVAISAAILAAGAALLIVARRPRTT